MTTDLPTRQIKCLGGCGPLDVPIGEAAEHAIQRGHFVVAIGPYDAVVFPPNGTSESLSLSDWRRKQPAIEGLARHSTSGRIESPRA